MRKLVLVVLGIFLLSGISAICEANQIDINSASAGELDELTGIGPVKAQAIVDTRPFDSVDDLINVYGIGEVTLQKIKTQELACVEGEEKVSEPAEILETSNPEAEIPKSSGITGSVVNEIVQEEKPETISLAPKDIKEAENSEGNKGRYAVYGFVIFCVLLGILFLANRRKDKNEFDE